MGDHDRKEPRKDMRDERASPLGRGSDPGPSVESGPLQGQGIAGPRGAAVPGEKGGPSGTLHRENEDSVTEARRDETGQGDAHSA